MTPQAISGLPTWLHMLAQVYPPHSVALVGAGNGTGPLVQWLQSQASQAGQAAPAVTLLEPHAPSMAQLAKRLAATEAFAEWRLLPELLAPEPGEHTYHQYTLAAENGLLPSEALHRLWPSLQLQSQVQAATVPLAQLLPAGWLLLDCLPAAQLLQGTRLPASTQVVLARVVLSDAAPAGSSLASVQALLAQSGFKAVATFAERNSALGKALFVRDPKGLQEQIEQLEQHLQAEARAKNDEARARAAEHQAKEQALTQVRHLEQAKAKAQLQFDELAMAKEAETKAKSELQSQLEQVNQALRTEKAAKQAESQARIAEQQAKELEQARAKALEADKAQLTEAKDKAIAQVQQLAQEKAQALQRCDELAKAKETEAQTRTAEQQAKEQALAKAQALEADKAQLTEAKDKAIVQVQQLQQEKAQAQQRLDELAKLKEQTQSHAEIDALKNLKDEWAEINKNPYAHNRVLTASLNSSLREFANKNLGLQQIKPAYLDYLALKAQQVEKNCIGRLATTVQDAVTRQLVVECLADDKAHILEIGALYGVGMAILYNHAITRAQDVRLICLDPFDGYYGKAVDALLNQPVNDQTFKRNMKLANVAESDYSIVKRYSTDPLAFEEVKQHTFNLLVIDGDHSYKGVKFDFEKFFPLLEKGGYVVFDDYNAKEWPGVQQFIDEDLKAHVNLQYLGAFSRTAVGRKLY